MSKPTTLVEATPGGSVFPSAEAMAFVDAAAKAVLTTLTGARREFTLMPYRHCGTEYLGFDWWDDARNEVHFTFFACAPYEIFRSPPEKVGSGGDDVAVGDLIDALLLVRLIADRVNGIQQAQTDHSTQVSVH
ncbi:hypothetical protein [Paraburkholderia susongensis]|uniref:Uncharacterized protein n=1 Tax=Paraburkholderia susongensis TaxID=1515439 RepID=A0A1X7M701_9BURK|nr:hypothetical protein [Paraburkholderia susongensis]SMG61544.1 hypothetical protein SAMN06265784_12314 [Paraburkholderia susongensis]